MNKEDVQKLWNSFEKTANVAKGKLLNELSNETKIKDIKEVYQLDVSASSIRRLIHIYECNAIDGNIIIKTDTAGFLKTKTPTDTISKYKEIQTALNKDQLTANDIKLYVTPNSDIRTPKTKEIELKIEVEEAREEIEYIQVSRDREIEALQDLLNKRDEEIKELKLKLKVKTPNKNDDKLKETNIKLKKDIKDLKLENELLAKGDNLKYQLFIENLLIIIKGIKEVEAYHKRKNELNTETLEAASLAKKKLDKALSMFKLNKSDSLDDVKRVWKKLAKTQHPDKGGSDKLMQELNECFETIKQYIKK